MANGVLEAMIVGNPLYAWLEALKAQFAAGERPDSVIGPFGSHGVLFGHEDDADEEYAIVGFCLPDDIYAEVDVPAGYGMLEGFRLYF